MAPIIKGTKADICQKRSFPVFRPSFEVSYIPIPMKKRQIANRQN